MGERPLLVAVVDDEEPVRRALKRLLTAIGIDVETYASGQEFLGSLAVRQPDCVVLDVHMPGVSGLEVQEQLALRAPNIGAVIVTGHHEPATEERALAANAVAYLEKPLDEARLLEAITAAARVAADRRARPRRGSGP